LTIFHLNQDELEKVIPNVKSNQVENTNKEENKVLTTQVKFNNEKEKDDDHHDINKNDNKSFHVKCENNNVFFPAVPVKVKVKGRNKFISTYLGLDTYSSSSFMSFNLAKKLELNLLNGQNIEIQTMSGNNKILTYVIHNLEIYNFNMTEKEAIPVIYCKQNWPFSKKDTPSKDKVKDLEYLSDINFNFIDSEIGILVGMNASELMKPLEIRQGPEKNQPFAVKYKLGWSILGTTIEGIPSFANLKCHRIQIDEIEDIENQNNILEKYVKREFADKNPEEITESIEDKRWKNKVQHSIARIDNGKFSVCLPFKDDEQSFPDNKSQAFKSLYILQKKFLKDNEYFKEYKTYMDEMIDLKYAIIVPSNDLFKEEKWYLLHHSVRHKQKNKLRIVFNASMQYNDVSLNSKLMVGPDLISSLQGIILRFRQGKYAFITDIKRMFLQIHVSPEHQDYLRFLWFPANDLKATPIEYRMQVHIFGAISSPSIANYVLKETTKTKEVQQYSEQSKEAINNNFYVDDLLKSVDTEEGAISVYKEVKEILKISGFQLSGLSSNSRKLLQKTNEDELSKNVREINLSTDDLPEERALGLIWKTDEDSLAARIDFKENTDITKRVILRNIFSIYHRSGYLTPAILKDKKIFQTVCEGKYLWDQELPLEIQNSYKKWLKDMEKLKEFSIPRWYNYKAVRYKSIELHYFADGSEIAFSSVAYIRYIGENNDMCCSFVLSKSRLIPLNKSTILTIPRIELCAAKLSIVIQQILHKELDIKVDKEYFWTDSLITLQYIKNETKRFKRFVSNRVSFIRKHSQPTQWSYCPSNLNISDIATKGINVKTLLKCASLSLIYCILTITKTSFNPSQ